MIALMQPDEGVQLGNLFMTNRGGELLVNSDSLFALAQLILAIVVPVCYNNGGSFIDANDPLLLPIHNRESSNLICDSECSVWVCSRCKRSLRKHKLPFFASVNNMSVPPVPPELSCLNSMEKRLICKV